MTAVYNAISPSVAREPSEGGSNGVDAGGALASAASLAKAPVRLIDMIFPGDTNHHGTLFGGVALAHMDKVAFLAAARHGRVPFVTAASQKIDFAAPARIGEMIEATGTVCRVGKSSLDVEVALVSEHPVTGERRLCTRGLFTLVAVKGEGVRLPLPPLSETGSKVDIAPLWPLHMVDMVFPPQTNHHGTLYGGDALSMMGKAAFIAASRRARAVMVMAASERVDFVSPIRVGEMIELVAGIIRVGRSSVVVGVELWAEDLMSGDRRRSASARFTMVAVNKEGRPEAFAKGDRDAEHLTQFEASLETHIF